MRGFISTARVLIAAAVSTAASAALATPGELRAEAHEGVNSLVTAYLAVQESLVADSLEAARGDAAALAEHATDLKKVAMPIETVTNLKRAAETLAAADDIATARTAFGDLSTHMLALVEAEGAQVDTTLFRAHCPMALGDGADWLQADETVANPYFGQKMVRCGTVKGRVGGEAAGADHQGMHPGGMQHDGGGGDGHSGHGG